MPPWMVSRRRITALALLQPVSSSMSLPSLSEPRSVAHRARVGSPRKQEKPALRRQRRRANGADEDVGGIC